MMSKKNEVVFRLAGRLILLVFILTLSVSFINAAGVARPYWNDNPLKLAPGESKIVKLSLQNMPPGEDMIFRATLISGSEIATIIDESTEYSVPLGSRDVPVNIEVKIPENVELQSQYEISISFQQIASGEGGMIRLATGFTTKFPVEIVGFEESEKRTEEPVIQPAKSAFTPIMWIIIAIAVIIAVFLIRKRQQSKR